MSIVDTLVEISHKRALNKAERISLMRIAIEYEKLQAELKKAYGRITALSLKEGRMKIADVYQQQQTIINSLTDENKRLREALEIATGYVREESTRTTIGQLFDIEQALKGE